MLLHRLLICALALPLLISAAPTPPGDIGGVWKNPLDTDDSLSIWERNGQLVCTHFVPITLTDADGTPYQSVTPDYTHELHYIGMWYLFLPSYPFPVAVLGEIYEGNQVFAPSIGVMDHGDGKYYIQDG